jgi:hypothetical protein
MSRGKRLSVRYVSPSNEPRSTLKASYLPYSEWAIKNKPSTGRIRAFSSKVLHDWYYCSRDNDTSGAFAVIGQDTFRSENGEKVVGIYRTYRCMIPSVKSVLHMTSHPHKRNVELFPSEDVKYIFYIFLHMFFKTCIDPKMYRWSKHGITPSL